MGLLMSDTTLIDPLLDDTFRLQDDLVEYAYATDVAHDEGETADPPSWPLLLIWPQHQMASV
jgi:hypothetical protein